MAIRVSCPSCGLETITPDNFNGRKVRCRKCKAEFIARAEKQETPPTGRQAVSDG